MVRSLSVETLSARPKAAAAADSYVAETVSEARSAIRIASSTRPSWYDRIDDAQGNMVGAKAWPGFSSDVMGVNGASGVSAADMQDIIGSGDNVVNGVSVKDYGP